MDYRPEHFTTFEIDGKRIDVDVDSTAAAHARRALLPYAVCKCGYCRNIGAQRDLFPIPEVRRWLEQFGIDPDKPTEAINYGRMTPDEDHFYQVVYHAHGYIKHGRVYRFKVGDTDIKLSDDIGPPPEEEFPACRLQIEVEAKLPWVLDEPEDGPGRRVTQSQPRQ